MTTRIKGAVALFFNIVAIKEKYMDKSYPVVLSIAGSDPSGGAGIQADIKSISAMGGYAAAAITAVTVQNTMGVREVEYMPPRLVASQIAAVFEDLSPDAVKIGMTGTGPVIEAVAGELKRFNARNTVCDPVMVATSKDRLTMPEAVAVLIREIFPLCCIATPNLDETSVLVGERVDTPEKMKAAAEALHKRYGCAFLVKGGDMKGGKVSLDILCDANGTTAYEAPRVNTSNLHGTGCTLSSAIATLLGKGMDMHDAVKAAKDYVHGAIVGAAGLKIGHGNGPLRHFHPEKMHK